jgi:hypothetical protein
LRSLAAHFGIQGQAQTHFVCIVQWSQAKNIWHSAVIRTTFYLPVLLLRWPVRKMRIFLRRKTAERQDTL